MTRFGTQLTLKRDTIFTPADRIDK